MKRKISTKKYARKLRQRQTRAERALWPLTLIGYRRQRAVHGYIPDFYSRSWMLAVEVQGSVHQLSTVRARDRAKRRNLASWGIQTLYVPNWWAEHARGIVLIYVLAAGIMWLWMRFVIWTWYRVRP